MADKIFVSLVLFPFLSQISFAQPENTTSQRPDIPWLTPELAKQIEPLLADQKKSKQSSPFQGELGGNAKGPLTPEQRQALREQQEALENAESLARSMTFGVVPSADTNPLAKEYHEKVKDFRNATIDLVLSRNRHVLAFKMDASESKTLENHWHEAISRCHTTRMAWLQKCAELYASDTFQYGNLGQTLLEAMLYDFPLDRVDGWTDIVMTYVRATGPKVSNEILIEGIGVCIANHRYKEAQELAESLRVRGLLDAPKEAFLSKLPEQEVKWQSELQRIKEDSEKGNNPIVELRTSKGIMKIELFEDDAPEAVNAFVYLVERDYYNMKTFFRVERHTVVQSGCEKGDGSGDAGFTFKGEPNLPTRRGHFRGYLAIALGSDKEGKVNHDSGSSQFYIAQSDLPHLDEDYTVFGRIVEGIECLGLYRQMNLAKKEDRDANKRPDLIISAKMIRKREHVYKPNPVAGKVFK